MNVLVTGGTGYLGAVLVSKLLATGHRVKVLDNLRYDQTSLLSHFINPRFEFVLGDVRDKKAVKSALDDIGLIVHLAGIAGDSACILYEKEALETNVDATKQLIEMSKGRPVIYLSCLRGFRIPPRTQIVNEETVLIPQTIYARTKHAAENTLLDFGNALILRIDTLFGLSPRMRLDLMVNDFMFKALHQEVLVIYEAAYRRFLLHVTDAAEAVLAGVNEFDRFRGQIINLGSRELTLSKQDICLSIKEHVNFNLIISDLTDIMGKEDYLVSFDKAHSFGFLPRVSLEAGMKELASGLAMLKTKLFYSNTPYY